MENWSNRTSRSKPVRPATFETLSDAAAAGEIVGRDFRASRAEAGLASVSGADGDPFSGAGGTKRLRELRILSRLRMRSGCEVQLARCRYSGGGEDRPLRNSS